MSLSEVGFEPTPSIEDQKSCTAYRGKFQHLSLAPGALDRHPDMLT